LASHAVQAHATQVIQRRGLGHRLETVLHRAPAHLQALADLEDAGHIGGVDDGLAVQLLDDIAAGGAHLAHGVAVGGTEQTQQLAQQRGLQRLLALQGLHAGHIGLARAIVELQHGMRKERQQPLAAGAQSLGRDLDDGLLEQGRDAVGIGHLVQMLFEQVAVEGQREQVGVHGHVEHELLAALQEQDALVIGFASLHMRGARGGDGEGKADLVPGRLAMLHDALVDALAEGVATPGRQLHQRTLQLARGNLCIGLLPCANGGGMHMYVLKTVNALQHGLSPSEPRLLPASVALSPCI
ncbi:conserved hypothetical protein, partial [Ricinus communis]